LNEIRHRQIRTNGINMHIAEAGMGPLVVLLHGFPELWYSWRHQIPALAASGFHAVAPDIRGYGQTDAPHAIKAYSMREMTADVVGILDALGEREAVVVGHDWGSPIAWNSALLYPHRFRAVAALSVPFIPRGPMPPLEMLRQMFKDRFFYMLYFQEEGVAEAEFESDVRRSMLLFMWAASAQAPRGLGLAGKPPGAKLFAGIPEPESLPPWLTEEDLDYYVQQFKRSGFRGPLNRYRCMDLDWHELAELAGAVVKQPAIFIGGELDPVATFAPMDAMNQYVPNLKKTVMLPDCGHWTQQEKPEDVNRELIEFLRGQ
jgi:pimeloyl-ACP methyl ester carboxylesterase